MAMLAAPGLAEISRATPRRAASANLAPDRGGRRCAAVTSGRSVADRCPRQRLRPGRDVVHRVLRRGHRLGAGLGQSPSSRRRHQSTPPTTTSSAIDTFSYRISDGELDGRRDRHGHRDRCAEHRPGRSRRRGRDAMGCHQSSSMSSPTTPTPTATPCSSSASVGPTTARAEARPRHGQVHARQAPTWGPSTCRTRWRTAAVAQTDGHC